MATLRMLIVLPAGAIMGRVGMCRRTDTFVEGFQSKRGKPRTHDPSGSVRYLLAHTDEAGIRKNLEEAQIAVCKLREKLHGEFTNNG